MTMAGALVRQRGQATVEFVVAALALVPLLITVALIGKYLDLAHATEQASRYVAFEGAVRNSSSHWKSESELAVEVRRRFFSNSDAPLKTGDVAGDFPAHRNPLWSDASGRPLIRKFEEDVAVRTQVDEKTLIPAAVLGNALALPRANLHTASVTVKPADIEHFAPFDKLGLSISRRTVLVADAWTARNGASVRNKIEGAGPAVYPIQTIKGLVNTAGQLPALVFDPPLRVGDFDWDIVPCDRLVGGC